MIKRFLCCGFVLLLISCSASLATKPVPASKKSSYEYVNPFIGTGGHGHTYPGATLPFAMMQLSPDTRLDGWDGCSGYHYSDNYIYGFSHTHLSGTGVSDYGDILLMPTNTIEFNNGADGKKGYKAPFSHQNEKASPGYYKVHLDSTNIDVALTVTQRAGMHTYQYPNATDQVLILDLAHRDKLLDYNIHLISETEVSGYRFSEAWAKDQRLYFHIKFSKPYKKATAASEVLPKQMAFEFINPNNEPVYVSIGISAVDAAGALKNLEQEIGNRSFEEIKKDAEKKWQQELDKIAVTTPNEDYKTIFYTALYHTMIAPNLYQDVDGRYRGMDLNIHQTKDFDYYTVFSLWDTHRAAHPLYTIIDQKRTNDFIQTFLAKYKEGGILPIWDLSGNYTGCMIGYHAVPVIADAYLKGIRDYDTAKALEAMKHSAMQDQLGLKFYKTSAFIPVEEESESVSKTLEYAYDDWTIAAMAKEMGDNITYINFTERAQYYKNVYDPATHFMRGRFRNTWFSPFDPYEVNFNYTEANAWQYSLYAPQDMSGLARLMGGKKALEDHLDAMFTARAATSGREQADITGLIGQYAHGNEPSHHMAYLYNFVNKPEKTQEKIHTIVTDLYTNSPDGISGNEDCGQMSAWYVFSSLGFYPVTPGSNQYIIGTPLFKEASIMLENGKQFNIEAPQVSNTHIYIQSVLLNNKPLQRSYITHEELMAGGTLFFTMGPTASAWASKAGEEPVTAITEHLIVPAPFIAKGEVAFKDETEVALDVASEETVIYYSLNASDFEEYKVPFVISEEKELQTYAEKNGKKSSVLTTRFYKMDPNLTITLETNYANQYNGGGKNALIDGIKGARDFRTGAWQGYQNKDVIATVGLGKERTVKKVNVQFLQDQRSWIFYPTEVTCYVAGEDLQFTALPTKIIAAATPSESIEIQALEFVVDASAKYVKIVAKNLGDVPSWHLGAPYDGKAWLFIDEIEIK